MPIEVSCPHCGKEYKLAENQVGKKVECRKCNEGFVVRDPDEERDDRPQFRDRVRSRDRDDDRGRSRDYDDDRDRRRDRDDDDRDRPRRRSRDDEDDRPRRRKSGGMPGIVWALLIGGPILLIVIVGVVILLSTGGLGTRITQANADRIKPGMSEAEVNAIIGQGVDYEVAIERRMGRLGPDEQQAVKFVKGMMEMAKGFGVTVKIHDGLGDNYISVAYQNGRVGNAEFGNWRVPRRGRFR